MRSRATCGCKGQTIDNFNERSAGEALALVRKLRFRGKQEVIAQDLIPEIEQRLRFMDNVGLGYLALGPFRENLERRRIPTHPARGAARLKLARRPLRPR
jgi:excinuclease UvrABC ATPase subunit